MTADELKQRYRAMVEAKLHDVLERIAADYLESVAGRWLKQGLTQSQIEDEINALCCFTYGWEFEEQPTPCDHPDLEWSTAVAKAPHTPNTLCLAVCKKCTQVQRERLMDLPQEDRPLPPSPAPHRKEVKAYYAVVEVHELDK